MPIVNVHWSTPITKEQKKEIMDYIVDAVHETTDTKKDLVYVFFHRYEPEDVTRPGCPVVQINWTAQPARSFANKAVLIKRLSDLFATYEGVNTERSVVIITDTPLESAGVGGVTRAVSLD